MPDREEHSCTASDVPGGVMDVMLMSPTTGAGEIDGTADGAAGIGLPHAANPARIAMMAMPQTDLIGHLSCVAITDRRNVRRRRAIGLISRFTGIDNYPGG